MSRLALARLFSFAVALGASGCAHHGKAAPTPPPRIGLIADATGFRPGTFGAAALAGLAGCARETGATYTADATPGTDYAHEMTLLATEGLSPVIVLGPQMAHDLAAVAPNYDFVRFAIVDGVVPQANVTSIAFADQEGAFLAGALAASFSRSKRVAFLGGADVPAIAAARYGFAAGAATVDPHVAVTVAYAGSFTSAVAGAASARMLAARGVDVTYVVAGRAGLGAIRALARAGRYAIGTDSDQDAVAPGHVLTSVVRRYDTATARICFEAAGQKPVTGTETIGLAGGGITLTRMRYTRALVGPRILARLNALRDAIVAGSIRLKSGR